MRKKARLQKMRSVAPMAQGSISFTCMSSSVVKDLHLKVIKYAVKGCHMSQLSNNCRSFPPCCTMNQRCFEDWALLRDLLNLSCVFAWCSWSTNFMSCRAVLKMWLYESFWVQCFICLQMFQWFSTLYNCLRPERLQWTAKVGIVWWIPCLFCGSFEMYDDFAVLLDWCQCWSLCHFWLAVELQEPWDSSKSST